MSAVDANRPAYPDFPETRESRRLVDVTVQGQKRLTFFDEPSHSDAADMQIQGNVLKGSSIERGTV